MDVDINLVLLGILSVFGIISTIMLFLIYFQNKDIIIALDFILRKK